MNTSTKLTVVLLLVVVSITSLKAQDGLLQQKNWLAANSSSDLLKASYASNTSWEEKQAMVSEEWQPTPAPAPHIDKYYPRRGTDNFINVYVGLNNYLEDDKIPSSNSLYSLDPINSWYLGLNLDNVTHVLGPLYLDWGFGFSWQEYGYQNTRTRIDKGDNSITFYEEMDISGRKSKMTVSYLNVHMVPTFSFGRYRSFRVGFGMFAGYRIYSQVKYKYDDVDGNKQKDKYKDNYYINQFRYGFRGTMGWDFFDLFFNYEITELFEDDVTAPRLNPISFGVIF
ncbi:porin family protein [Roseivirga pacifica]